MPDKPLSPWYWIAMLGLVAIVAAYAYQRDLYALYLSHENSDTEVRMLAEQVEELKAREAALALQVSELQDDPLELEAAIRKTKRLVRPGETIYRVSLPESSAHAEAHAVP